MVGVDGVVGGRVGIDHREGRKKKRRREEVVER
jgi:uncharacterized protein Veg